MEKTDYFSQKTRIQAIMDKSPRDSNAIFIYFSVISGSLIKHCILFEIFFQFSLPPLYTRKKFWIHASNIVCGVRGGVRPV